MNIDLPQLVFKKTGTVLDRTIVSADEPRFQYIKRTLVPGKDTFLSQKGVAMIKRDSDDKIVRIFNNDGQIVLSDIPQKIRPYFDLMRQFPNVNLNSFIK